MQHYANRKRYASTRGSQSSSGNICGYRKYLESLDESECFVDRASDGEVVHGDLAEDAPVVDDEETSQSVAVVLQVDAVVLQGKMIKIQIINSAICLVEFPL